ncbi:MAG: hypothetical protein IJY44_00410 [Bacteroidaceae bacterium]|nr:hypothetical protein [Bacteroidaceae bacterium]
MVDAETPVTFEATGTNNMYAIKVNNNNERYLHNNQSDYTREGTKGASSNNAFGFIEFMADGIYTINNVYDNRGTLCYGVYNGAEYFGLTDITLTAGGTNYAQNNVSVENTANKYWYVVTTTNGTYLFNLGKHMFLQNCSQTAALDANSPEKAACGDAVAVHGWEKRDTYVCIKDGSNYLSFSCGWAPNDGQVRWVGTYEAEGNNLTLTPVTGVEANYADAIATVNKKIERNELKIALNSLIEQVVAWNAAGIIGEGVGQRSSTNENAVNDFNAIVEYYNGITNTTEPSAIQEKIDELQAIIDSYSIINMPVDGKAYTFKNVQKDAPAKTTWIVAAENTLNLTMTESEATPFICRKLDDGKYAFVNNAGKYLCWRSSSAGGIRDAYDTSEKAWTDVTITKMTTAQNVSGDLTSTRYVSVWARRYEAGGDGVLIVKKEADGTLPTFNTSSGDYWGTDFSSAFIMDEVEYANKPVLNAVGTSPLLTSELHNTAMATFSAPFATVVPEGVTAYYATAGDGFVTLNAVAATAAVPANTGVVLVGTEAGSITMAPAAGETAATIENNVLAHSAGAAKDIPANSYILSAFNGEAGFYRTSAGTLAMNKAYIAAESQNQSIEVRFPGTTAIEEVKGENGVEAVYDLQGRRINEITKPGIYVVGGVKRVVK